MKLYNCVMLRVSNPALQVIDSAILKDYSEYINYDYINEHCQSWINKYVENDPHITLIYGLNPGVGNATLYHTIKIKNRDEYKNLRSHNQLTLSSPKIDTFDNDGCRVLKVNVKDCDLYPELEAMMKRLCELPNDWQYKDDYNPRITLTYLKPDTPDSVIEELNDKYADLLKVFNIGDFMISSDDPGVSNVEFL